MKGKLLRILLCGSICLLLGALLIACGDSKEPEETEDGSDSSDSSSESTSDNTDESLELDTSKFNIFFEKDFVCTFVLPKNATDAEKQVASLLNQTMKAKTGKAFIIAYEGKAEIDDTKNLILIGNTSYAESKNAYKGLDSRSGRIKIVNNKMAIAFNNESSGKALVEKFAQKIDACKKTAVNLPFSWTAKYTSLPERQEFVEYSKDDVKKNENKDDGTVLYTSYNNSPNDFSAYCKTLEDVGFVKDYERTQNGNFFTTYKGENDYIYVYYMKNGLDVKYVANGATYNQTKTPTSGVLKVVLSSIDKLVPKDMTSSLSANVTPKIATVGSPASDGTGMGYIFVLPDGRLIIEDGGDRADDFMYKAIREVAPNPDKIVIAAWFISHPHGDHQNGFFEFIQNHGKDKGITIERVIYNYASSEQYNVIRYDASNVVENGAPGVESFYDYVERYIPDVQLARAHTGQVFDFGNNVNVEVLFTIDDILPNEMVNANNASIIIRVDMGDSDMLLLADDAHMSDPMLIAMWGDYLKSDMVQIAHHAMWTPHNGIYKDYIKADVLFMPTTYDGARDRFDNSSYNAAVLEAYRIAKDMYISDYGVVHIIELSSTGGYTVKNNKTAEWTKTEATKS